MRSKLVKIILAILVLVTIAVPLGKSTGVSAQATTVETMSWGYLYHLSNGDTVEVGDSTTTDFKASVKTIRNDGSCYFSLWLEGGTFVPTLNGLVVSFDFNTDINVSIYPVEPCERLPEGGIEYDVKLLEKPAQNTVTFNVDWQGITWQKILALNVEYNEAKCEEQFGLQGAPYTMTATSITGSDLIVYKTRAGYEVNSYLGIAVNNRRDTTQYESNISYTRVSRTHLHIHRGLMTDNVGNTTWVEDISLNEVAKTITFTLPRTWLRNAVYPVRQVCGVDPAYTQDMDSWQASDNESWSDYDLFTNKTVPKGAVAEVILSNSRINTEYLVGIRADGSELNRYVFLHEAEGGGQTNCRMFVVCHATTGLVECYVGAAALNIFYLAGYWENVGFTELATAIAADSSGAWDTEDLDAGYASRVLEVIMSNNELDIANTMGVRAVGSSIERKLLVHEQEAGGSSLLDLLVKADANGDVQLYSSDATNATFLLAGYFGSEMDFVERWQEITLTTTNWEAEDLTAYLDQDGRMVDFLLTHEAYATVGVYLGVRDGDDAVTERKLLEHEAEWTTADTHELTGFGMSAQSNASGVVNLISSNAEEVIMLAGYFKPTTSISIDLDINSWVIGIVRANETKNTGLTYYTVTNDGGVIVDIKISGIDMTGTAVTWDLDDTGTPGDAIYGLKAGLSGGSYNIIVRETVTYNFLKEDLATSGTQAFGLELYAPTSSIGNVSMSGTVTLTASLAT